MKIRHVAEGLSKDDKNNFNCLKVFGLFVTIGGDEGSGFNVYVSDEEIPKVLFDELEEYPPNGHDWSESEHDVE